MRMHCLRHVPFEDEAAIGQWARARGYEVTAGGFYLADEAPAVAALDWLVVMGGPMGVGDVAEHPWLEREKAYIADVVASGARVLGICLGAQLVAECLGATVTRNPEREIGWLDVELSQQAKKYTFFAGLPERFMAFHWHGDTFSTPPEAVPLGSTAGCLNQGFLYQERVLGLQFHLESTPATVESLLTHCADEMTPGPWVQDAATIRNGVENIEKMRPVMEELLLRLERGRAK